MKKEIITILNTVAFDLEQHADNWECETFTKDHGECLLELATILKEISEMLEENK